MHINKPKEMMRSILPSKARKWAKHKKRQVNRSERRHVTTELSKYNWEDDDDSDLVCELHTAHREYKRDMKFTIDERRNADKISHFVRWAKKKTEKQETIFEKYYRFVSLIGGCGDVIRRHAVGHFIEPRYDFRRAGLGEKPYRFDKDEAFPPVNKDMLIEGLKKAIREGREDTLNAAVGFLTPHQCSKSQKCWKEETKTYRRMEWELLPDGSRKRLYLHLEDGRLTYARDGALLHSAFKGCIGYNTSYKNLVHSGRCNNRIRFDGEESAKRVVTILHRRKKNRDLRALWEIINPE